MTVPNLRLGSGAGQAARTIALTIADATSPCRYAMFRRRASSRAVSVRTRIVAIALIPVIGFLANGIAFIDGADRK